MLPSSVQCNTTLREKKMTTKAEAYAAVNTAVQAVARKLGLSLSRINDAESAEKIGDVLLRKSSSFMPAKFASIAARRLEMDDPKHYSGAVSMAEQALALLGASALARPAAKKRKPAKKVAKKSAKRKTR